jgi:mannosyltransferase OCH1-like enzyme
MDKVSIPKIIMQTWKNTIIPTKWKSSVESIHKFLPEWKYVLQTDTDNENFVRTNFPDFLPYYLAFPHGIQRADAIRYMWLYMYGGVYMDLDYEVLKSFNTLFTGDSDIYLIKSANVSHSLTNSFMASKPGVPFWLEVIEQMKIPTNAIGKHFVVMNTTGPMMLTKVFDREKSNLSYKIIDTDLVNYCTICQIESNKCVPPERAYVKPLPGASWNGLDSIVYNYVMCNWKLLFVLAIIIIFIVVANKKIISNYFSGNLSSAN